MKHFKFGLALALASTLVNASLAIAQDTTPIKIGILEDQTSVFSALSGPGAVTAAQMAIDDFGGKVLGRPVQLVVADDQNKADVGLAIARQWYDQDVQMITGLGNSATALAVQGLAKERGKVDIAIGSATTDLTNKACSPTGFHWVIDTYSFSRSIVDGAVKDGAKKWFFITVDYALGHSLEDNATKRITELGGTVSGTALHPLGTTDYSSYILQAQASDADTVALAMAGTDLENAIKASNEFGLPQSKRVVVFLLQSPSIIALGLDTVKGVVTPATFFPTENDASIAWSKRFMDAYPKHTAPTLNQAGMYSAVTHYLKAVQAAGTDDGKAVAAKMHELPINDFYSDNVQIRVDGMALRPVFITRVKDPSKSTGPQDLVDLVATVPGADAYPPLASETDCDLAKAQ